MKDQITIDFEAGAGYQAEPKIIGIVTTITKLINVAIDNGSEIRILSAEAFLNQKEATNK